MAKRSFRTFWRCANDSTRIIHRKTMLAAAQLHRWLSLCKRKNFMILELKPHADEYALILRLERMGFQVVRQGQRRLSIVRGVDKLVQPALFTALPEVEAVLPLKEKFKLVSKAAEEKTVIEIKGKTIGG